MDNRLSSSTPGIIQIEMDTSYTMSNYSSNSSIINRSSPSQRSSSSSSSSTSTSESSAMNNGNTNNNDGRITETSLLYSSATNTTIENNGSTNNHNDLDNNNKMKNKLEEQQEKEEMLAEQQQEINGNPIDPYRTIFKQSKQHHTRQKSDSSSNKIGRFTVRTFDQLNPSQNFDDQSPYSTTTNCFDTITSLIPTSNFEETEYESDSQDVGLIMDHGHDPDDEEMAIGNDHNANRQLIIPHTEVLISRLRNEVVKPKNFNNEVRAGRDVKSFLANPCVLLDLEGDSVEEIIDQMLTAINNDLDGTLLSEARSSLYDAKNAFQLSDFLQGIYHTETGEYLHDPTWLCTFATVNNLSARRIVIARLDRPSNFGPTLRHVQFIVLVLVPSKEKTSKSAFEIARTFASLFADSTLRMSLLQCESQVEFCQQISDRVAFLKRRQSSKKFKSFSLDKLENHPDHLAKQKQSFGFGKGLVNDFRRRIKYYPSDFIDGIVGKNTISKVSAAVLSIFFACILPPIAFGVVNEHNTHGLIGPKQGLIGQAIGGLIFALTSGQPLVIIATTAPLTLYVKIVYQASQDWHVDFLDLFAAVGCFCAFYLILYALLNVSNLMRYVTRSTEETFATFVFVAFTAAAFTECHESFRKHYCFDNLTGYSNLTTTIIDLNDKIDMDDLPIRDCLPAKSILFLFLMLGTVAMAVLLYNFSSTPYLNSILRNTLADYALPLSVISFSLIGSVLFRDVHTDSFIINADFQWRLATFRTLTPTTIGLAAFLGFFLSMLFFIAQSVCASIVGSPSNHLKKGSAFHWDLFVLGSLNAVLSMIGLPWIYGILPHSPLHARLLADVVPATDSQHNSTKSYVVVRVRETRVTGVLVHLMIGSIVLVIPNSLSNIPVAVLCGLFLYCAISTLRNNSIHDRVVLVLTEQHSYPPTSYLRHVPQRTVHCFTATQLALLALITFVGFCPWKSFRLFFPFMIALMIPIRRYILPLMD
ncbi:anion exchange protein-like protein 1 [Dermatophagoides farinae]|uniref:Anion exchange protein-like protein 1 n=1 Tax=Dermatophagoides farinae TaxID=6954 RepID=A0A9D4SFK0_DERFA|nr:anion exchange protein-like protein 1 [Dermatophagoides farinae]